MFLFMLWFIEFEFFGIFVYKNNFNGVLFLCKYVNVVLFLGWVVILSI